MEGDAAAGGGDDAAGDPLIRHEVPPLLLLLRQQLLGRRGAQGQRRRHREVQVGKRLGCALGRGTGKPFLAPTFNEGRWTGEDQTKVLLNGGQAFIVRVAVQAL